MQPSRDPRRRQQRSLHLMGPSPKEYPPLAQIRQSPAFHTAIWDLVPHRSGLLPVAADRGGALKIAWEVHGDGPIKVLLICGLGLTKASYQRQTLHFGHNHGDKYSLLLIENRGVGGSDKPWLRWYSTNEMARDAVEVLDHLGWGVASGETNTIKREVHVMGISMGGMIAQELALLIPDRIASLGLVSTSSAFSVDSSTTTIVATAAAEEQQANLAGTKDATSTTTASEEKPKVSLYEAVTERLAFMTPKSVEQSVQYVSTRIYAAEWIHGPDDAVIPDEATPRCNMPPSHINGGAYGRFGTNYERCAAQDVLRRETPPYSEQYSRFGLWAQMFGAATHRKTKEQLQDLADKVGRDRIWIVHGDRDAMIDVSHGERLRDAIQPAYWSIEKGMGHGAIVERTAWFNELLEERCRAGETLSGR